MDALTEADTSPTNTEDALASSYAVEPTSDRNYTLDYSTMNVTELKAVAKEKGIRGYSSMNKAMLLEALTE